MALPDGIKFEDSFNRFDKIPVMVRHLRTDGRTTIV